MGAEPRHPAARGPPPRPACDWLGGRVCPPRRGGEGPLWAPGGRRRRTGRRERGPQGASEGAGEPGSGDPRAGSERGGERRPGERGGEAGRARRRRPLHGALSGPPARTAPQPSGRKRRRQRPGRALGLPHLPASGGSPGGTEGRAQAGRGGGEKTGRSRRSPAAPERLGTRAGRRLHGDRARGAGLRTFGRRGELRPLPAWDSPGSSCPAPVGGDGDWADPRGARPPSLRRSPKCGCARRRGPGGGRGVLGPILPALTPRVPSGVHCL